VSRLVFALHDPWMAVCLATARPGTTVATFGGDPERDRLSGLTPRAVVVPLPDEPSTRALLAHPDVAAMIAEEPTTLLSFKPAKRLEEAAAALGATYALAPAALAGGLENKLALAELAEAAGVDTPRQTKVRLAGAFADAATELRRPLVVQSPRGNAGRRTWEVADEAGWRALCGELGGRPAKAAEFVTGRPGTLNAVVDHRGSVVVSAPIVQATGIDWLTPFALGSCGNDFTWRPLPHPGDAGAELAEALGRELAKRGYRGHFGVDFVLGPDGPSLIEINPRLTASFALYAAWVPEILDAHLMAVAGGEIEGRRLPPVAGGQLIATSLSDVETPAIPGDDMLPGDLVGETVWTAHDPVPAGSRRGRWVSRGAVIDEDGALVPTWRPERG
jgi:hypothetical protein